MRIGRITTVKKVSGSKNLFKFTIDVGNNQQKVAVAGIAKQYSIEQLVGQQLVVIMNLEPRKMFGILSEVMILAAQDDGNVVILQPEKPIKTGSKIS